MSKMKCWSYVFFKPLESFPSLNSEGSSSCLALHHHLSSFSLHTPFSIHPRLLLVYWMGPALLYLQIFCISKLLLHNKSFQNLVSYNNNHLLFPMDLWVSWVILLFGPDSSALQWTSSFVFTRLAGQVGAGWSRMIWHGLIWLPST